MMNRMKNLFLNILGTGFLLYSLETINAADHPDKDNESELVKKLTEDYRQDINQKYGHSNNPLSFGMGLSSLAKHKHSLKWIDQPSKWHTHYLDNNTDDSISEGTLKLGDLKKRSLNLQDNNLETLLNCYLYSKFQLKITNDETQEEFKNLLEIFSSISPDLCQQFKEKAIMKNVFGLPQTESEFIEVYILLKKNEYQESARKRLVEIPYCYMYSFEKEIKKNEEMGEQNFRVLKNEAIPLELKLKSGLDQLGLRLNVSNSNEVIKIWYDMLYDQNALLTADHDTLTDAHVFEGKITLGALKKKVLEGHFDDFVQLILCYKDNRFKLPKENYVAQEATEWLSLYAHINEEDEFYANMVDFYAKVLTENWFGKVSQFIDIEKRILSLASKRGNLAARGLLSFPPFSKEILNEICSMKNFFKTELSSKDTNDGCVIS